jgi:hypothetical protein
MDTDLTTTWNRRVFNSGKLDGLCDGTRQHIWLDMLRDTLAKSPNALGDDAPSYIAGYIAGMAEKLAEREVTP